MKIFKINDIIFTSKVHVLILSKKFAIQFAQHYITIFKYSSTLNEYVNDITYNWKLLKLK